MTDDLAQFLHARIAEDEEVARTAAGTTDGRWAKPDEWTSRAASAGMKPSQIDHLVRHDPARVLAECDAKRRIVREAQMAREAADAITGMFSDPNDLRGRVERAAYTARDLAWHHALVVLALPHVDHPEWREEWHV